VDIYRSIQLIALKECLSETPSEDYTMRRICRAYSKVFFTPLHEVENLPFLDVFQAVCENSYEELSDENIPEAKEKLLKTQKDIKEKLAEDKEEADVRKLLSEMSEPSTPPPPQKVKDPVDKIPQETDPAILASLGILGKQLKGIGETLTQSFTGLEE